MTDVRADFFDAKPAERERERVEAENRGWRPSARRSRATGRS